MFYPLDVQAYRSGVTVMNLVVRNPGFTKEEQPHDFGPTINGNASIADR
jgi:hypothetical protein